MYRLCHLDYNINYEVKYPSHIFGYVNMSNGIFASHDVFCMVKLQVFIFLPPYIKDMGKTFMHEILYH